MMTTHASDKPGSSIAMPEDLNHPLVPVHWLYWLHRHFELSSVLHIHCRMGKP